MKNCNCITQMNELLKPRGLELNTALTFSSDGSCEVFPVIGTNKLDPKDRKVKTASMFPTFCPFCGVKCAKPATKEVAA